MTILFKHLPLILWAIAAILVARAVGVYLLSRIGDRIPLSWQHVLYWGGLRGAICLALALSLPEALGEAVSQIRVMAFGVVVFTLLVQGFSMAPLVRRLHIVERSESQDEYERRHARAVAGRSAYEHLQRRHRQGLLSDHSWEALAPLLQEYNKTLTASVREIYTDTPRLEAEELETAQREYLRAERSTLNSLLKDGIISDDIYAQLTAEIDAALVNPHSAWPELFGQNFPTPTQINRLMAAIIQQQDIENALSALTKIGVAMTCLSTTGGFLSKQNTTLLIGLEAGQEEAVVNALDKSCQKRVEYLASLFTTGESKSLEATPVTLASATIFTFKVERFDIF